MTIIDMYSRWIEAFPTSTPDALTVAKCLTRDIIPRFGIPERIYCDNGSYFANKVIQHLTTVFATQAKYHCSYHPQSAGLIERTNGKNWIQCLPLVMMNMHILPSTRGLSPFEILYGRPYLPELKPFVRQDDQTSTSIAEYMAKMLARKDVTSSVVPPSQESQSTEQPVKPGNWVFIKVIKRKTWHSAKWEGPYQVLLSTPTAVRIAERSSWVHLNHCKRVHTLSD
ncbi:hypothetical protein LDENG_00272380 [Lucifuga dentata]|nr:hypothetical protein LDENG_00272380 [Lucifuga dentata]